MNPCMRFFFLVDFTIVFCNLRYSVSFLLAKMKIHNSLTIIYADDDCDNNDILDGLRYSVHKVERESLQVLMNKPEIQSEDFLRFLKVLR